MADGDSGLSPSREGCDETVNRPFQFDRMFHVCGCVVVAKQMEPDASDKVAQKSESRA
jgi:hypothetical protein